MLTCIYLSLFCLGGAIVLLLQGRTEIWPYVVLLSPVVLSEFFAAWAYNRDKREMAHLHERISFWGTQVLALAKHVRALEEGKTHED